MHQKLATKQSIGMKGIHRVILADTTSPKAKREYEALMKKRNSPAFPKALKAFNEKHKIFEKVIENVTQVEGRTVIAKALSGNISAISDILVNYGALGTGTNAPATSDTQLQTETFRKLLSSKTYADNIFYGTAFYAAGEATSTLQEHGLFIAGTASANSGSILSRLLLGGLVKGAGNTLTIETQIQINDA